MHILHTSHLPLPLSFITAPYSSSFSCCCCSSSASFPASPQLAPTRLCPGRPQLWQGGRDNMLSAGP
ncbi:hypothetical protein E2C01_082946 [Portunus trituberculatus]|uniref:Uncharacterized protein n=1 Tax=Portunus trituberculatus TaxID=210409 RepID=A0A5B7J260_PORTR|nr:hypothetical protein [Portunus trituberculatus]